MSYGSVKSKRRLIMHRVPQGSVLGPTLLNLHINDITYTCTDREVVLYTDDMKIHVSAKDVSAAEKQVNKDLESTVTW